MNKKESMGSRKKKRKGTSQEKRSQQQLYRQKEYKRVHWFKMFKELVNRERDRERKKLHVRLKERERRKNKYKPRKQGGAEMIKKWKKEKNLIKAERIKE